MADIQDIIKIFTFGNVDWKNVWANACLLGRMDLVKYLIKNNMYDIDEYWNDGVAGSCYGNQLDIFILLTSTRSFLDPDQQDEDDMVDDRYVAQTLYKFVCRYKYKKMIEYFQKKHYDSPFYGFLGACKGCHNSMARELFNDWKNIHETEQDDCFGEFDRMFRCACKNKNMDMIEFLLKIGRKIDCDEALLSAYKSKSTVIIDAVLRLGAKNVDDIFESACNGGDEHMVRFLKKHGAKTDPEKEKAFWDKMKKIHFDINLSVDNSDANGPSAGDEIDLDFDLQFDE